MQASKLLNSVFSKEHLRELYLRKKWKWTSVGLDWVSPKKFGEKEYLEEELDLIVRKVTNGSYHFTRYRQILVPKGPDKPPRNICVPTIRDKLTSLALNELLTSVYGEDSNTVLPHVIISEIIQNLSKYDSFIKLDVRSFFGNIDQEKLIKILKRKIRKPEILSLISNAIRTEAISCPVQERSERKERTKGIPEGLPISTTLANIYVSSVDKKYKNKESIAYFRYVDDILILVNESDLEQIKQEIHEDIKKLGLELNEKEASGKLLEVNEKESENKNAGSFEYLGYLISKSRISVRQSSILKMEQSIADLIKKHRHNPEYLEWKLNQKITGFTLSRTIDDKTILKTYGWLFYYSRITDVTVLYHLDNLVNKLIRGYGLDGTINPKRFVRTYFEIRYSLYTTNYIPNLDNMSVSDKRAHLSRFHNLDVSGLDDSEVGRLFIRIEKKNN